jgi:predicted ATPase
LPTAYDTELLGRERETAALGHVLESAATSTGSGSALLLRGEAGIGKTALLDRTADLARAKGFAVLRAVGSEAEAELAFGALHQVLWPLMERSEALPERQREALESALGLHAMPSPTGGFLVGAAALTLLAEATREGPLLVLLDDLQWVDSSSATTVTRAGGAVLRRPTRRGA